MKLTASQMQIAAIGWDAAVESMRYEDGTPVELVKVVNPFRPSEALANRAPGDTGNAAAYVAMGRDEEAGKEQEAGQ